MKTYEDYSSSPDGWNVSSTLELEEDGRFFYPEGWTDYTNASLSGGAGGTWRRGEGVIIFRVERVYPPINFPWNVGGELVARLRDDALDFGQGWTLRPPTPRQEYTLKTPVSNTGTGPLTLVLEPWGTRHTLAPGERAEVVARGRWWEGEPKIERRDDELVFDGRNGSWATVVPKPPPPPPKPPAAQRASRAEAAQMLVTPAVKPTVKPPAGPPAAAKVPAAKFEPRAPSHELAALLRRWIDEPPAGGPGNSVNRLCKENDAVPLDCTETYLWVLRTDGRVLCIDHESFAQRAEPEEDAEVAYGKIEVGARTHPELLELLPPDPGGIRADGASRSDQQLKSVGVGGGAEARRDFGGYYNRQVADWAKQNIRGRVEIRPLFSSRAGRLFVYALLFCVPGAFFALGLAALVLGMADRYTVGGSFFIGLLSLIPCAMIALLGTNVRQGFARSLDSEGVSGSLGRRFPWGKLYYVDHVTKHVRAGRVSRRVKDNQIELVFKGGKVIIPPLIHERAAVWELINAMPAEVRDDGAEGKTCSRGRCAIE